jgi:hypothetical protein
MNEVDEGRVYSLPVTLTLSRGNTHGVDMFRTSGVNLWGKPRSEHPGLTRIGWHEKTGGQNDNQPQAKCVLQLTRVLLG